MTNAIPKDGWSWYSRLNNREISGKKWLKILQSFFFTVIKLFTSFHTYKIANKKTKNAYIKYLQKNTCKIPNF